MRSLLSVLVACALIAPVAPARAAHPTHCGATWSGSRDCLFRLGGMRLKVTGSATASGTARVHVWIAPIVVGTQQIPILECSSSGAGSASCSADIPAPVSRDPNVELVFDCRVEGATSGSYHCYSTPA